MKGLKSTLDGFEHLPGRAVGNSTRQIDLAIQYLLNGYIVKIEDHATVDSVGRGNWRVNRMLFERVMNRLSFEHSWIAKNVVYDERNLTIYLPQRPKNL